MKRLLPAALALLCGCTHLLFSPTDRVHSDPADEGYSFEAIKFSSKDGVPLTGLFFRPPGTPLATVVHFHGNGENMTSHYRYSAWLAREGFNVFVFDYRGYGASGGVPELDGAVLDGIAALEQALKLPGAHPDRLVVFGQSLGGALAIAAAAEGGFRPAALVVEGSFYSYRGAARAFLRRRFWGWPLLWLPGVAITGRHTPAGLVGELDCPKLFLHSRSDLLVPYAQGRKLFEAAAGPKEFWDIPGGHTEAFGAYASVYRSRLTAFLKGALPQ